MREQQYRL